MTPTIGNGYQPRRERISNMTIENEPLVCFTIPVTVSLMTDRWSLWSIVEEPCNECEQLRPEQRRSARVDHRLEQREDRCAK